MAQRRPSEAPKKATATGRVATESGTTGSAAEQGQDPKCRKYACDFQYCLQRHNHDVDRCRVHYEAFRICNGAGGDGGDGGSGGASSGATDGGGSHT